MYTCITFHTVIACIIICLIYMQEDHDGIFANVQILESHPSQIDSYFIAGNEQIHVSSINKVVSWPSQLCTHDADGILVALTEEVRDLHYNI